MLFVTNRLHHLWGILNTFSNCFDSLFLQVVSSSDKKIQNISKLRFHNGGWHETLNLVYVSRGEMFLLWLILLIQTKIVNKPGSSVRSTDWKSSQYLKKRLLNFVTVSRFRFSRDALLWGRWTTMCEKSWYINVDAHHLIAGVTILISHPEGYPALWRMAGHRVQK